MKPETIKAIFTNLLFVIGVVLTVLGFIRGSLTIARTVYFDKYPLNSYEETRCEIPLAIDAPRKDTAVAESTDDQMKREENCKASLEKEREIRQFEDTVNSAAFLIAGLVLTFSFRRFILK